MRLIGWAIALAMIVGAVFILLLQLLWIGLMLAVSIVLFSLILFYWRRIRGGNADE